MKNGILIPARARDHDHLSRFRPRGGRAGGDGEALTVWREDEVFANFWQRDLHHFAVGIEPPEAQAAADFRGDERAPIGRKREPGDFG